MRRTIILALCLVGCAHALTIPPGEDNPSVVGALIGTEHRIMGDIMKYGFPDTGLIRYREGYVLSYDARNRVPRWVSERLSKARLMEGAKTEGVEFRIDRSLAQEHRSESADYKDSGYVRGRMAAAANHKDRDVSYAQTFYMSNVAPQLGATFRRTFWLYLERRVRAWAADSDDLYVVTGPLFLPESGDDGQRHVRYKVIGKNNVAVPTHFFKVMLRERDDKIAVQAFVVPHAELARDMKYSGFIVSVDELESLSGLDFFSELSEPLQSRLEVIKPDYAWGEEPGDE